MHVESGVAIGTPDESLSSSLPAACPRWLKFHSRQSYLWLKESCRQFLWGERSESTQPWGLTVSSPLQPAATEALRGSVKRKVSVHLERRGQRGHNTQTSCTSLTTRGKLCIVSASGGGDLLLALKLLRNKLIISSDSEDTLGAKGWWRWHVPSHEFVSCDMRNTQHRENGNGLNLKSVGSQEPTAVMAYLTHGRGRGSEFQLCLVPLDGEERLQQPSFLFVLLFCALMLFGEEGR